MRTLLYPVVLAAVFPTLGAADEASFVENCTTDPVVADFNEPLCTCAYGKLSEVFEEGQVARIGTLFSGSPSQARDSLRNDDDPAIRALTDRIEEVEDALISCIEELGPE